MKKDYYKLLRVTNSATGQEIKRAYFNLAKEYHPDLNEGCKEKAAIFNDLTHAYQILVDQKKRDAYDRRMGFGRRVQYDPSSARNGSAASGHPLYTAPPPPGMNSHNFDEWNAWHHGDNAVQQDPITFKNNSFVNMENKHTQFFARQQKKVDFHQQGNFETFRTAENSRQTIIDRSRLRRQMRKQGIQQEDELQSCSIS
mmetsp:Transcript_31823/g.39895  ORF Transcript_31823/g.39895 Transcript_31823/m.39895 type:complete len:199 (+) Transcript_31823:199-795(+)